NKKTNSTIRVRGFREHGSVNIKGLEGVDILWVDEAQALTKKTLDIIIPTIRKEKSKIFFSMNRYLYNDPVFVATHGRDDCLHIHIDYFENKHCPEVSKKEAEKCKATNLDDYNHIWLGKPLQQANNAAFRGVNRIVDHDLDHPIKPVAGFNYVLGVDLAKSVDHTVLSVLCIQTKSLVYWERMENENKASWFYQKQKIQAVSELYNKAVVVTDSTGVGDPITEDLQRMGCNVFVDTTGDKNDKEVAGFKFTNLSKENLVEKLKVAIELQLFKIPYIKVLVEELIRFEATRLPSGKFRYAAPEGKDELGNALFHDDSVMSLALALWGSMTMIYDPKYQPEKEKTKAEKFWAQVKSEVEKNKDLDGQECSEMVEIDIDDSFDLMEEFI
ncbi:MAG: phage terminase large subunit, partial [Candidatus Omnitrophica bacterium]|nr:phage terminase large subunit [Candidatus Omnitrophota bacterium]